VIELSVGRNLLLVPYCNTINRCSKDALVFRVVEVVDFWWFVVYLRGLYRH